MTEAYSMSLNDLEYCILIFRFFPHPLVPNRVREYQTRQEKGNIKVKTQIVASQTKENRKRTKESPFNIILRQPFH